MPLDDQDKADIAAMIAESQRTRPAPAPARSARPAPERGEPLQSDWDRMTERDRQAWVRREVEDHIASLDAEVERENLKAENEQLRQMVAEWEKQGRPGKRPTKADTNKPREEEPPTVFTKAYKFLFGEVGTPGK